MERCGQERDRSAHEGGRKTLRSDDRSSRAFCCDEGRRGDDDDLAIPAYIDPEAEERERLAELERGVAFGQP